MSRAINRDQNLGFVHLDILPIKEIQSTVENTVEE